MDLQDEQEIRWRLANGKLPRDISRVGGGSSSGKTCDACGKMIDSGHTDIEVITKTAALALHPQCFHFLSKLLDWV
ncbi:MAG TPA: hypothetical protein VHE37_00710 [Nevskiaceae bacterium]|nr:hypothetical protein [Nevskiaceae bacterium]